MLSKSYAPGKAGGMKSMGCGECGNKKCSWFKERSNRSLRDILLEVEDRCLVQTGVNVKLFRNVGCVH